MTERIEWCVFVCVGVCVCYGRKDGVLPDLLHAEVGLAPQPLVRVANEEVPHNLFEKQKNEGVCIYKWVSG